MTRGQHTWSLAVSPQMLPAPTREVWPGLPSGRRLEWGQGGPHPLTDSGGTVRGETCHQTRPKRGGNGGLSSGPSGCWWPRWPWRSACLHTAPSSLCPPVGTLVLRRRAHPEEQGLSRPRPLSCITSAKILSATSS